MEKALIERRERLIRGIRGYASILRVLMTSNATTAQLSAVMSFGGSEKTNRIAINRLLRRLAPDVVHIAGWAREIGCPPCEIWAFGPGENAPAPPRLDGSKRTRINAAPRRHRIETMTFASIIIALRDGHSVIDLAELSGSALTALYPFMRHAHSIGLVHIAEWHRQACSNPRPVFVLGAGRDAPRPKPLPKIVTDRRYNAARKSRRVATSICRMMASPLA